MNIGQLNMHLKWTSIFLATMIPAIAPRQIYAKGSLTVTPYQVLEVRRSPSSSATRTPTASAHNTLTVGLILEGPSITNVTHIRGTVIEARDDLGNDLSPDPKVSQNQSGITPANRGPSWIHDKKSPRNKINAWVSTTHAPPRSAKKIAKLKGMFMLMEMPYIDIPFMDVANRVGMKIESNALKSAGIEITVRGAKLKPMLLELEVAHPGNQNYGFDNDGFGSIELVNKDGLAEFTLDVNARGGHGHTRVDIKGRVNARPSEVRIRISLRHGCKINEVPFEVRDIPLH